MPRAALTLTVGCVLAAAACALGAQVGFGLDPHMDPSVVQGSCRSCHRSHGEPQSPMLPTQQSEVCLSCHGSQADLSGLVAEGVLATDARPRLLDQTLTQGFTHPLTPGAFSRHEDGAVTCTSCHSPHRRLPRRLAPLQEVARKPASNDPNRFEYELCGDCHGRPGRPGQKRPGRGFLDGGSLLDPSNRSFHPVEAPAGERSTSVHVERRGRHINCTDCHGNSDPDGPAGPHGSAVQYLLRRDYATVDGAAESAEAYALCYSCHDRRLLLEESPFPFHFLHVVEARASCATCHSAHGSAENRALVRYGEETVLAGVAPSAATGRLAFVSNGQGSGTCYLTCHGYDHAPESYGGLAVVDELALPVEMTAPRLFPEARARPDRSRRPRPNRRPIPPPR